MIPKKTAYLLIALLIFKLAAAQVQLQTGSATFSLPMFNWQDDKSRLTSVVALSYNSGNGLKVNDVASNVGQGWNLIAGGVITRMQVGEPDDQQAYAGNGNHLDEDITRYPAGFMYASIPSVNGCPNALTRYPIYGYKNQLYKQHNITGEDREKDYFAFQFNGKSGMFIIDTAAGGAGIALGDTKMKISFQTDLTMATNTTSGTRTTIKSFTITDVDGLIYRFTTLGRTKVLESVYCDRTFTNKQTQPKIKNGKIVYQKAFDDNSPNIINPWVISSWHLTEIEDGLTHRKITFSYNNLSLSNYAGDEISNISARKNYCLITRKLSVISTMEIASITYPDGHNVQFNYGANRYDYPGQKTLESVDVTYNGRYISKYALNSSYFILNRYGTPVSDYQKRVSRLCLRSVKKYGVDLKEDTPPYLFNYYLGSSNTDDFVPPPFFYAKDIWGFYNGNNSRSYFDAVTGTTTSIPLTKTITDLNYDQLRGLCFLNNNVTGVYLNPNPGYAKNGLLKQIIYPTGGVLTYQYGQNKATMYKYDPVTGNLNTVGGETTVGGVSVSQTLSGDGGYNNGCSNQISTQYLYVVNGTGSASSMWGAEMPENSIATYNHYAPEWRGWHWNLLKYGPFGQCYWHFLYPGILSQSQAVSLTTVQQVMNVLSPILGILSIISDIRDVVNVLAGTPGAVLSIVIDIITGLIDFALTCIGSQSRDTPSTTYNNYDIHAISPLPAQFKRVEIIEGTGGIGKTVQEFTSWDDYSIWANGNIAYSSKQRYAPWAYGLPKKTSVFDNASNLVKTITNTYDWSKTKTIITTGPCGTAYINARTDASIPCSAPSITCARCNVYKSSSQRNTDWSDVTKYTDPAIYFTSSSSGADMQVDMYNLYTGRTELMADTLRIYRVSDQSKYVETVNNYYYNTTGNYELRMKQTKQSNGDLNINYFNYSSDYKIYGGVFTTLSQNNIIALPITTASTVFKNGATAAGMVTEKVTELTQLGNGDIKPLRTLEQRFQQPSLTAGFYSPTNPNNSTIYKVTQNFSYDGNGNLTGLKDEGGRSVYNLYDYNDKYIVASVINADPTIDKVAYTSFENTNQLGGWTLTGTASYSNSPATGNSSFSLLANSVNSITASGLNTTKAYTVSFWADNSSISVTTGATLIKSAPSYNGLTYYEYDIAAGSSSVVVKNISTTTNCNIDELRIYPKTARIRTTTYDPLLGKTSECDENNRVTYYTYDNLGRLQFIKDENKNIIKMYEYNNVSAAKQNGCPATYGNNAITETFIKSNCGAGYVGGEVIYTVPANKYTSAISQEDADAKAQNEILTFGQSNADGNTTACLLLYYNVAKSETDTTENCPLGYTGGPVTYTVAANKYSSTISQADADQQAQDEIDANAQAYANTHPNCILNTNPDWEYLEGTATYCLSVNGQLPPHLFVLEKDINPNSSSYNQTRWSDVGPDDACPANTYYNSQQSQSFTRNNCNTGFTGSTVTYTVPAGKYSSTVSQAAADQQAINDINANGQNYANTNGACTASCSFVWSSSGFGIGSTYSSLVTSNGTTGSFQFAFSPSFNGYTGGQIGTINGSLCIPSATRTLTVTDGNSSSRTWNITINNFGVVTISLASGTAPTTTTVIALNGTYNL